ncbi:Transcriptional regulator PadR-like family protein [Rubripirellula tenax]|uniref:Transcriptional regulator PadR-like family protein n=1 Tax=Rubripirellula tenax TaxID=2528015 RepID=A0A5C6EZV3_9BACT|nr:PadR family transcriptional regulator [Rubripirellula tenax]TWU54335.1 Transcriptional regulator PadR-like family protein [Rubripirellula tenax]
MSLRYILLALTREPVSGYDLNRVIEQTIRHFWAADQAQLYRTLKSLESDGLVKRDEWEPHLGPSQKTFTRTAKGKRELIRWLQSDPEFSIERSAWIAQLVSLHEAADIATTFRFIEKLKERFEASLLTFQMIDQGESARPLSRRSSDDLHGALGLRLATMTTETRIKWCNWALDVLSDRLRKEKR